MAQNIHIEATLRQPEWQFRVSRVSTKAIIKGALALQKANERDGHRNNAVTATGATRKNSDSMHSVKSKKMSPKKFKLGLNSKCHRIRLPLFNFCFNHFYSLFNSELKKSRNNANNNNTTIPTATGNRKMRKISTKTRKNKSRKNSHMSATSSDHHDMDIGSPNGSLSRSKTSSPTPTGYGYHR